VKYYQDHLQKHYLLILPFLYFSLNPNKNPDFLVMNWFYSSRFLRSILIYLKYEHCLLIQVSWNYAVNLNLTISLHHGLLPPPLLLLVSNEKFKFHKGLLRLYSVACVGQIDQHLGDALDFYHQVLPFHPSLRDDFLFFLIYFILIYNHHRMC
jgi:hypothetical protein